METAGVVYRRCYQHIQKIFIRSLIKQNNGDTFQASLRTKHAHPCFFPQHLMHSTYYWRGSGLQIAKILAEPSTGGDIQKRNQNFPSKLLAQLSKQTDKTMNFQLLMMQCCACNGNSAALGSECTMWSRDSILVESVLYLVLVFLKSKVIARAVNEHARIAIHSTQANCLTRSDWLICSDSFGLLWTSVTLRCT